MVQAKDFVAELKKQKLGPIVEVPCSIFKDLINYLIDSEEIELVNPTNEAIVMAHAAGRYIASGQIPVVMMQNSGLNNTLNSLSSLNKQYGIPAVYLVSWRGELKDAPEHNFMGRQLEKILETYEIPHKVLTDNYSKEVEWAASLAEQLEHPIALIMRKGFINKYKKQTQMQEYSMDRWQAIETIVNNVGNAAYVSTNGFISRQLYNILKQQDKEDGRAFMMAGSMGHALGLGIGEAIEVPSVTICVLDGDGGALMHAGSMGDVGKYKPNLVHFILDNRAYGSTGGQPSISSNVNFTKIGSGFDYSYVQSVETTEQLVEATKQALENCPALVHVKINQNEISEEKMARPGSCREILRRHRDYLNKFK